MDHYLNFKKENYETEMIKVPISDGLEIPVVMTYNNKLYNDNSPWVLFGQGAQAVKRNLAFETEMISLYDRGIVVATPMVRGTKYFDDQWFKDGAASKKLTHINDYIEVAAYLRN